MRASVTEFINDAEEANMLSLVNSDRPERRAEPRLNGPFAAVVAVVGVGNLSVNCCPFLMNLSADGFYLCLEERVELGTEIVVSACLSHAVVVLHGTVLRVEELADGGYGLAASINQYRILTGLEIHDQFSK